MPITAATLRWFKSERMTDEDDGGGRLTGQEIVYGEENQIFDDLSDVDRAAGDVSIRKVYGGVASADDDKYLDAGVVVFKPPQDDDVSVVAFSTGDYYDERSDLADRLESSIVRGGLWVGQLWGQHIIGQRAVVLWQRPSTSVPSIGERLELVAWPGGGAGPGDVQFSQIVWVTRIIEEELERVDAEGVYQIRKVTCEIAEPLRGDFPGSTPSRHDVSFEDSLIYETRYNADAVPVVGIRPLVEPADFGTFSATVDNLYTPLIPTSFSETAIVDVNPGGDTAALVQSSTEEYSFNTTLDAIGPSKSMHLGGGVFPGSLGIVVNGSTISDEAGLLYVSGINIGTIDYGAGVCAWNDSCPSYGTATKAVTFDPAATPIRVQDTASQIVTVENRGFVWVYTLLPIPSPGSLWVSYRTNNEWYSLYDTGDGQLRGVDSAYGSGVLDFETGSVTITTGGLPDPGSEILYAWSTPVSYFNRGGVTLPGVKLYGQTSSPGVQQGSFSISWDQGAKVITESDTLGNLSGDGTGFLNHVTGEWWIIPDDVPLKGTELQVDYNFGGQVEETFDHPIRGPGSLLTIVLNDVPLEGSVEVEWNLLIEEYESVLSTRTQLRPRTTRVDPIKIIREDGLGVLINTDSADDSNGSIDYANKTVVWLPDGIVDIPFPQYETFTTSESFEVAEGELTIVTDRLIMSDIDYLPAAAVYPNDESGWVKIRYLKNDATTVGQDIVVLDQIKFDLTLGYAEQIVMGSPRFTFGGSTYKHTAGSLYANPSVETGAGTVSGSLDISTGVATLTEWTGGPGNSVELTALLTEVGTQPIDAVVFRTTTAPIKPGQLQLRFSDTAGNNFFKIPSLSGSLEDDDCQIVVDYDRGQVSMRFGNWRALDSLSAEEMAEPWFDGATQVDLDGTLSVWRPLWVLASSIVYNAVATTMLPPDSTLLGLDAARLPPDGQALIYRPGMLTLAHHTDSFAVADLSSDEVVDCGRVRLYRAIIVDSLGVRLSDDLFTLDRELGLITMASGLDLGAYTGPYTIEHTVADLLRVHDTDINGRVDFLRPVTHDYPLGSYLSGLMFAGTLQARISNIFEQTTWTGVWSDTRIGDQPLASYNAAVYPIVVTNAGAYEDNILFKFTSATTFQIIGENLGLIGTGSTGVTAAPINALTGLPYFTVDYRGWGGGWATGNCLRMKTHAASYPVDVIRAVQPSSPTGLLDSVELLLIGNVDSTGL